MRFDFDIYKKKFPSYVSTIIALSSLIMIASFLLELFICLVSSFEKCYSYYVIIFFSFIYYPSVVGFLIYAICAYFIVNKSKTLDDIKSVKSDEFINSFIEDFVSQCQKSALIFCTIGITVVSLILDVISILLYYKANH